jgi:glycosyltransferase involved in cell wall biosynthesis
VTLLMPRGRDDPALSAADLRAWFEVDGDFSVVQRPSRWAGELVPQSTMWTRQIFRDPLLREADILYSRIPVMIGIGDFSPIPFATDHYRPWPDDWAWLRPFIRRTARRPHALGFVLHSNYAADSYRRIGIPEEQLLVAHNGADPRHMLPRLDRKEARARLGLKADRPTAIYAGRINVEKGLDQVLALARLRPDVAFVLVGSEGEGAIEREAAGIANVRIAPWQAPGALAAWLHAADVLLVPASRAPLERYGRCVLPMKLFSYLAAGRPILAPHSPDTAELLSDGETASLLRPDSPDEAAAALDRLLGDQAYADRLAEGALSLAGELSWDHRAGRIQSWLERRLEAVRRPSPSVQMRASAAGA